MYFHDVPIAAFTATATKKVQDDIVRILRLKDPFLVRASFNRKELFYRVDRKEKVLRQITGFILDHSDQAGIVYRTSRKDVEKTASPPGGQRNQSPPLPCGASPGHPGGEPGDVQPGRGGCHCGDHRLRHGN